MEGGVKRWSHAFPDVIYNKKENNELDFKWNSVLRFLFPSRYALHHVPIESYGICFSQAFNHLSTAKASVIVREAVFQRSMDVSFGWIKALVET